FNFFFFVIATAPIAIYTLSLHDALPIWGQDLEPCLSAARLRDSSYHAGRPCQPDRRDRGRAGRARQGSRRRPRGLKEVVRRDWRSEEHTSELQSRFDLVCRLLLEKKNI